MGGPHLHPWNARFMFNIDFISRVSHLTLLQKQMDASKAYSINNFGVPSIN
jgi:hypothetical protein